MGLARAVAKVVLLNSLEAWTELLMLPKCVLCSPPRSGKAHHNKRIAFVRSRLQRWLAGERASLWADVPQYCEPRKKRVSDEAAKNQRHLKCIELCGENAFGRVSGVLAAPPTPQRLHEV